MSVQAKNYLDLTGLSTYNGKIKDWANSADQVAYKTVIKSADGNSLYFYKKANAILGTDNPNATIALGGGDSSAKFTELANKIGAEWSGNTLNLTAFVDGISATTIVGAINEVWTDINTFIGTLPDGQTTVTGYIASAATTAENNAKAYTDAEIEKLDADLDASGTAQHGGTFVVSGITEADGVITGVDSVEVESAGAAAALAATLATVATSGAAGDVSYDNTTSGLTATNVKAAIDEVAAASAGGVASKTVYLQDESAGQIEYAKVYKLYQGADSSDMKQNVLVGTINIAKDKVVQDGHIVTVEDGVDSDGDTVPVGTVDGTYVKLTLQNVATPIYINVQDLIDVYTGGTTAEATVTISATNEITVTINNIAASKITHGATTVEAALNTIEGDNTTVGSIAKAQKDAQDYADGAVSTAVSGLTGSAGVASITGDVITIKGGVTQTNGKISNDSSDDITISPISTTDINNLFA